MAVVTGGMRDRVNEIINNHFRDYFSATVTSDDVKDTKPFPEPYLKGASSLGLAPKDCIVVENAPMGIKAGKQAGMFVIAITTTLKKEYLEEADLIVESFDEVNNYLLGSS
jgi:beta-phosphoglucomutase